MLRSRVGNTVGRFGMYKGQRFRAFSRELFFRCAGRFTPELIAESDGMRFRVPTYDRAVGLMSFANGPPERGTMELALSMLETYGGWRPPDGSCFLEIGANIGTATVTALREGNFTEAVCFEPLPANHQLLLENLVGNDVLDRVQALNIALSDRDGVADFEISPNNSGDGRVRVRESAVVDGDAFEESARTVVEVELARLDSLCEKGLLDLSKISLVWIDAQGHEGQILSGASRLLQSQIPVVTELWPYGLKRAEGKQTFIDVICANYERIIDLGSQTIGSPPVELEANQIASLVSDYEKSSFFDPGGAKASTDLLLL